MKSIKMTGLITLFLLPCLQAQEQRPNRGEPVNTIAVMSEDVIRARLHELGYNVLTIHKTNSLRYQIEAVQQDKFVLLDFHPQLGTLKLVHPAIVSTMDWMPKEFTPSKTPREK